jgi:hypothetical protein
MTATTTQEASMTDERNLTVAAQMAAEEKHIRMLEEADRVAEIDERAPEEEEDEPYTCRPGNCGNPEHWLEATMMKCYDRLSGERFEAADEAGIRAYLAEALTPGETVDYEVETDSGQFFDGETTGA